MVAWSSIVVPTRTSPDARVDADNQDGEPVTENVRKLELEGITLLHSCERSSFLEYATARDNAIQLLPQRLCRAVLVPAAFSLLF